MMKPSPLSLLSDSYLVALKTYLEQASPRSLRVAHDLGEQAVALGLETFALAGIHQQAIEALALPKDPSVNHVEAVTRAAVFFTEAIIPIEETHRFAVEAGEDLQQLKDTLEKRTQALSASKRELQKEISGRMTIEAEVKNSVEHSTQLLMESRLMEEHLQTMIRKILSTNEVVRKKMSHLLQDEIAQTLLGIHVRLLKLKKEAEVNNGTVRGEIATIEQLVERSVKTINQIAHEFSNPHEA